MCLVALGLWGAIIPFVGPYFGYEFGSDQTWAMSWNRLWLDVLPGAAVFVGGLFLIAARNRVLGAIGGWLALAGGVWFVAGPTVAGLWDGGAADPIGAPIGSQGLQVLELLGYFYALGAAAVAFSAFALGRLSVVGIRDVEAAAATTVSAHEDVPARHDGAAGQGDGSVPPAATSDAAQRDEGGRAPARPRRRLFRRS